MLKHYKGVDTYSPPVLGPLSTGRPEPEDPTMSSAWPDTHTVYEVILDGQDTDNVMIVRLYLPEPQGTDDRRDVDLCKVELQRLKMEKGDGYSLTEVEKPITLDVEVFWEKGKLQVGFRVHIWREKKAGGVEATRFLGGDAIILPHKGDKVIRAPAVGLEEYFKTDGGTFTSARRGIADCSDACERKAGTEHAKILTEGERKRVVFHPSIQLR